MQSEVLGVLRGHFSHKNLHQFMINILFLLLVSMVGMVKAADIMQPVYVVHPAQVVTAETPTFVYKNLSISTTPVNVKLSATEIRGYYFYNHATAGNERYVKFFNRSTAPTIGVTVPDLTIPIGGRSSASYTFPRQVMFSEGLWICATKASGDLDLTLPGNGDVLGNIFYK